VIAALARGKRAHMGRANSYGRVRGAISIGCTSSDGTFLKFAPTRNLRRIERWFVKLDRQMEMPLPGCAPD